MIRELHHFFAQQTRDVLPNCVLCAIFKSLHKIILSAAVAAGFDLETGITLFAYPIQITGNIRFGAQ